MRLNWRVKSGSRVSLAFGFLSLEIFVPALARADNCATQGDRYWSKGQEVKFCFDTSTIGDPNQVSQIITAISIWNAANTASGNGTLVHFSPLKSPTDFSCDPAHPAPRSIVFKNNLTSAANDCQAATVDNPIPNQPLPTTVTFNINKLCADPQEPQTTWARMYQAGTNNGYESVFLKVALHEIGHTMGLNDTAAPQYNAGLTIAEFDVLFHGVPAANR